MISYKYRVMECPTCSRIKRTKHFFCSKEEEGGHGTMTGGVVTIRRSALRLTLLCLSSFIVVNFF